MNIYGPNGYSTMPFQQHVQERFKLAEEDNSASLSVGEMASDAPKNINPSAMEARFAKIDSNGDGSISLQERDAIVQEVKSRMQGAAQELSLTQSTLSSQRADAFDSLLQALSEDKTGDEKNQVDDLLSKLQQEGRTDENVSKAAGYIHKWVPSIDTMI